jgi:nitroreductase
MSRRANYRRQAMDVNECLNTRLTIRQFKPDRVPVAVTRKILEAGRSAPSSRNRQPWQFVVITDSGVLKQIGSLAPSGPFIADAPMAIAVFMQDAERPDLDAGRAIQQMEIMAWSEGLGTCYVGMTPEEGERIKEWLGIPEYVETVCLTPLGYPRGSFGPTQRTPAEEVSSFNRYGSR